jgi:hypothetical protein
MSISLESIFRERVKRGPENRISVVADKAAARGPSQAMTDPSGSAACWRQAGTPSSGSLAARSTSATVACAARARATVPPSRCPAHGRPVPRAVPLFVPGGYWAVPPRGLGPGVKPVPAWGGADLTWQERCGVMPAVPGGRPARPAVQWPARAYRRPPSGIPRPALPAFPSGRTGPRAPARAAFPPFPFPRSPRPPPAVAGRAGAGLDGAGGAERPSSRTHGQAAPGNANRSRPAPRRPGRSTRYYG